MTYNDGIAWGNAWVVPKGTHAREARHGGDQLCDLRGGSDAAARFRHLRPRARRRRREGHRGAAEMDGRPRRRTPRTCSSSTRSRPRSTRQVRGRVEPVAARLTRGRRQRARGAAVVGNLHTPHPLTACSRRARSPSSARARGRTRPATTCCGPSGGRLPRHGARHQPELPRDRGLPLRPAPRRPAGRAGPRRALGPQRAARGGARRTRSRCGVPRGGHLRFRHPGGRQRPPLSDAPRRHGARGRDAGLRRRTAWASTTISTGLDLRLPEPARAAARAHRLHCAFGQRVRGACAQRSAAAASRSRSRPGRN